jgi:hypothetical protein
MGFATIALGIALHTGSTKKDFSRLEWSKKTAVTSNATSTYKGGNYCGPGWGFTYKDILDGRVRQLPAAIDAIDEACKVHDYCYEENGYFTQGCNLVLTYDLVKVVVSKDASPQQRVDAVLMAAIFFIESQTIDLGVMAKEKVSELKNRLEGLIAHSAMTLEQAINKELLRGR